MSTLIAAAFDDKAEAERVLEELIKLQKQHLIDLEDACIVTRDDKGNVRLKQAYNLIAGGAIGGAMWGGFLGSLVGMLFLNPLAGLVAGAAAGAAGGAATGAAADYGIDDNFIRSLGQSVPQNGSALFILVRRGQPDRIIAELKPFRGRILHTSLSVQEEEKLRRDLGTSGIVAPPPVPPGAAPRPVGGPDATPGSRGTTDPRLA
jgi:uncharacterized membrane protein